MITEILQRCEGCDEPRGPLSPIAREGGPRWLCPPCLHAFLVGEVATITARVEALEGAKGGEMMEEPTPCPHCREVVELQDMRVCRVCRTLICRDCVAPAERGEVMHQCRRCREEAEGP